MITEAPFTKLSDVEDLLDLIDGVTNSPTVTLLVDMVSLRPYMTRGSYYSVGKSHGNLAEGLLRFGNDIGRVNQIIVVGDGDPVDQSAWERIGVVVKCPALYSDSQVEHLLYCEAVEHLCTRPSKIYLFCCGTPAYTELARKVKHHGNVVALASPWKAGPMRELRQHCQLAFTLDDLLSHSRGNDIDVNNYDFARFIRRLDGVEQKLPFVGLKYFIDRIMPSLDPYADVNVLQNLFDKARELGLVVIHEITNKNPGQPMVSACRLDRAHPDVVRALDRGESDNDETDLDARNE